MVATAKNKTMGNFEKNKSENIFKNVVFRKNDQKKS